MGLFRNFLASLGVGKALGEGRKAASPSGAPEVLDHKFDAQREPPSTPPAPPENAPPLDSTPDTPEGFGYKVNWFAIRTTDPVAVLRALGLLAQAPANWASGMAAACRWSGDDEMDRWVFVSPAVGGWVFLAGNSLPYPVAHTQDRHGGIGQAFDAMFECLKSQFEEVQFFGSYRVVGFVAWARAVEGVTQRVFAFGDGEVYANAGEQSSEESELGFPRLDGLSTSAATARVFALAQEQDTRQQALMAAGVRARDAIAQSRQGKRGALPDEDDVVALAALWSIDPLQLGSLDHAQSPGVGFVARLPKSLRHVSG